MKYITDKAKYNSLKLIKDNILQQKKRLPEFIFNNTLTVVVQ